MDQNLLEYIGAQRVAVLRRRRLQGSCAGGGQQRLSQLVADSLGLDQVLGDRRALAASSLSPMLLITCISSVWRSTCTRVMRM